MSPAPAGAGASPRQNASKPRRAFGSGAAYSTNSKPSVSTGLSQWLAMGKSYPCTRPKKAALGQPDQQIKQIGQDEQEQGKNHPAHRGVLARHVGAGFGHHAIQAPQDGAVDAVLDASFDVGPMLIHMH